MTWIINIIIVLISIATPFAETSHIEWEEHSGLAAMSGCAAYYADGVMESTAVALGLIDKSGNYEEWLLDEGYIGAVAVYRLGDRGEDVHILWPDGTIDGPYISIDVVARNHYNLALDRNRVIDVDYDTAVAHGMEGPVAVTIVYGYTSLFKMAYGTDDKMAIGITTEKYKGCIGQDGKED